MALQDIQTRIEAARAAAGRGAGDLSLIAVSKVQPEERVRAVLEAGHRCFGENRVQEAEERWGPLRGAFDGIELHLVGPLQSNKLNRALELFDAIHSLDRDSLAKKLARAVQARGACPTLFIQINTGLEAQKAGLPAAGLEPFLTACRTSYDLPIHGLMCIPPVHEDPAPHFAQLRDLARANGLAGLSMGMSADFETAIAHGATHLRIGSAIFGARQ